MNDDLIRFDPSGILAGQFGLAATDFDALDKRLTEIRHEVVEVDPQLMEGNKTIPKSKWPLDAGFIHLPQRLLADYQADRKGSELGRILAAARRLGNLVDRVVVLGIGGSYMGAFALMQACCQPYYNELSRGDRGGRPRLYFEGNNVDNDSIQGLLHFLRQRRGADRLENDWAIVVISKSGGTIETAAALRVFLRELAMSVTPDALPQYVVPVTGESGKLSELAEARGWNDRFRVPDGVGGRFSIFSPVGLLPAAIVGLDVVALLRGAIAMTEHFAQADVRDNIVLRFVAANHLAETRGALTRVLSIWNKSLEAVGLWYDQLLSESLGKEGKGALPLTTVNTRDLHSRAQQHQEGRGDKLFNNVIVDSWRFDATEIGNADHDHDDLNRYARVTFPQLMNAAIGGTNQALHQDGRPTTNLHLPAVNEFYLGQWLQMLMLATVVEGRLIGVNPYGQPGVEKYKSQMKKILES